MKLGPLDPYVTSMSRIDSWHKICSLPWKKGLREYINIDRNNKMEDFPDAWYAIIIGKICYTCKKGLFAILGPFLHPSTKYMQRSWDVMWYPKMFLIGHNLKVKQICANIPLLTVLIELLSPKLGPLDSYVTAVWFFGTRKDFSWIVAQLYKVVLNF